MKKVAVIVSLVLSVTAVLAGCRNNIDLRELIETDVKIHNNPNRSLFLDATAGGSVSPASEVDVVDEVPVEISATASSGYAFRKWVFTEGEGFAVLSSGLTSSSNVITVSGSDVSMQAVFVRQPVVISTFPEDSDIARNMPVRIVFSKIVDQSSVTSDTVQIFDIQQDRQIAGTLEVNGSEVMFYARDSSLEVTAEGLYLWEPNRSYQVYIRQNVLDVDGIALLEEVSWAFSTGTEIDNTAPVISAFDIETPAGKTSYTNSINVLLVFDAEDESMIPIRAVKFWNLGESEPSTVSLLSEAANADGKIPFGILSGDGVKQVNFKVYDMAGNYDEASASIILDTKVPVFTGAGLIDPDAPPHDDDGFANTRSLSFQLAGTDENTIESLGYVIDDSEGEISWQNYTTDPVSLTLPDSDGGHTVYFMLRDEAGNVSAAAQDSLVLDRTAPTGTVQIKGGAGWICGDDRFAAVSLTRNDLSTALPGGEITIAVRADGDGWSTGDLSATREYSSELTDVDLIPAGPAHESGDTVTVSVRLIDVFGHERTITETVGLDLDAPAVSFVIQSLDGGSNGRTDYCKSTGRPYVQLNISCSDSGDSGLAYYRYDTDESGVNWSGWVENSSGSAAPRIYLAENCGNREAYVQVMDAAGNISATASDTILNYYHAWFSLYSVYVSNDTESGAGEIYWDFSLMYRETPGGDIITYNYIFTRPDGSGVSVTSPATFYLSNIGLVSGERRTLHWYKASPPYSFRIGGYLVEDDGATGDDWSDRSSYEVTTGSAFRTRHTVSVAGAPAGNIKFDGDDNYY